MDLSVRGHILATLSAIQGAKQPNTASLSSAVTGNGDSTNTVDTGVCTGPLLLKITSTVGAIPTVTVNIMDSADGTNFFNIPYSTSAAPTTVVVRCVDDHDRNDWVLLYDG